MGDYALVSNTSGPYNTASGFESTKWGSLIPFEKVADLLKEVLPVGESTNHETVREHLQAIGERIEADLGENGRWILSNPSQKRTSNCNRMDP